MLGGGTQRHVLRAKKTTYDWESNLQPSRLQPEAVPLRHDDGP